MSFAVHTMPKHLAKVQKKIAKKKGVTSSLHENSRDAKRLRRAGARSEKLERLAAERSKAYQPYRTWNNFCNTEGDRINLRFILSPKNSILPNRRARSFRALHNLTHAIPYRNVNTPSECPKLNHKIHLTYLPSFSYISRHSAELSALQSSRRPARSTSTREDTLNQRVDAEAKEYVSGFWLPDMEDSDTLRKLRGWNGEWTSLNTLDFIRIAKDGTRHPSSFPPKGKS